MRRFILSLLVLLVPMMAMAQVKTPPSKSSAPKQKTITGPNFNNNNSTTRKPPVKKITPNPNPKPATYIWVNGEKTTKATFSASASTRTFTVRTNAKSWSVTDKPSWCQVARKAGKEVDIKVNANTGSGERSGTIRIAAAGNRPAATIEVTQLGGDVNPGSVGNGRVNVKRTWIEENVERDGETGILFHAHVEAYNLKGQELDFQLWLYQSDESTQVHDTDGDWLWRKETHAPSYDESEWKDFQFFIPYSQFGSDTPRGQLCFDFDVRDKDFKLLGSQNKVPFNYNPGTSGTNPGTGTGNGNVTINRTWVEENVERDGQRGIMFHAHIEVDNLKGQDLDFQLWLYQSDESTQVHNTEGKWLWREETHAPNYDNTEWKDFKFFVPYSDFASDTPRGQLCFDLDVRDKDFNLLGSKSKVPFNYNPSGRGGTTPPSNAKGTRSVTIQKMWIEEDALKDGERGIMFHAKCEAKGYKGEDLSFYLWLYESDNSTQVKDTSGEWLWMKEVHNVTYESSLWEDFKFFVPYSKFSSSTPRGQLSYDFEIRDKDFKMLAENADQPFNYNPGTGGGGGTTNTGTEQGIIHKVWLEHGVYQDGKKGMKVHGHCEVKNMKGQDLYFMVWFYEKDDITPVKNTSGGHLYRYVEDDATYQNTEWKDVWFFIPYSDFNVKSPFDDDLAVDFVIRRKSNNKDVVRKDKTLFKFTKK